MSVQNSKASEKIPDVQPMFKGFRPLVIMPVDPKIIERALSGVPTVEESTAPEDQPSTPLIQLTSADLNPVTLIPLSK